MQNKLQEATITLAQRYIERLVDQPQQTTDGPFSTSHLVWMCENIIDNIDTHPVDKVHRWLGYIQGVMSVQGILDVTEERDFSRPLFHAAYSQLDVDIPPTVERTLLTDIPDMPEFLYCITAYDKKSVVGIQLFESQEIAYRESIVMSPEKFVCVRKIPTKDLCKRKLYIDCASFYSPTFSIIRYYHPDVRIDDLFGYVEKLRPRTWMDSLKMVGTAHYSGFIEFETSDE